MSIHVRITSQAYGGYGIARTEDGKVLLVSDAIEGDEVRVEIQEDKKSFAYASIVEHVQKNPLRQNSDCVYETLCGGCQWLTVPYEKQLSFKEDFLRDSLKRFAKTEVDSFQVHSSSSRHYRNRATFRGHIDTQGSLHLGFLERGTHTQVAISNCLNVDPQINSFLASLKSFVTASRPQKLRIEVQVIQDSLILTLHSLHGIGSLRDLQEELSQLPLVQCVVFAPELGKAPFFLLEEDLGLKFFTCPGAFQQVNLPLNQLARRLIKSFVDTHKPHSILDLFCGSGNLSLPLIEKNRQIVGVESSPVSIRIAQHNLRENNLSARYLSMPAHKFLAGLGTKSFDLVIADPPRAGMKECFSALKQLAPQHIILMACDPMTFARDLKELLSDYKICELHLLDFFPNTYHLESLVFLQHR